MSCSTFQLPVTGGPTWPSTCCDLTPIPLPSPSLSSPTARSPPFTRSIRSRLGEQTHNRRPARQLNLERPVPAKAPCPFLPLTGTPASWLTGAEPAPQE